MTKNDAAVLALKLNPKSFNGGLLWVNPKSFIDALIQWNWMSGPSVVQLRFYCSCLGLESILQYLDSIYTPISISASAAV